MIIKEGLIYAKVKDSLRKLYQVTLTIDSLSQKHYDETIKQMNQPIGSFQSLIEGRFPLELGEILTNAKSGLFPSPVEIRFRCSCPDWAHLWKHLGAVLYGAGVLLNQGSLLFFTLRGVSMHPFLPKGSAFGLP